MLYPENDPEGLKTFDCPECGATNAVIEDDTGYHCRACGARFGEDFFDDWRDGIEPEDEDYWKKENDPIWSRWYESVSEIHKKIDALEAQIEVERHNLSDLLASEPIVD